MAPCGRSPSATIRALVILIGARSRKAPEVAAPGPSGTVLRGGPWRCTPEVISQEVVNLPFSS